MPTEEQFAELQGRLMATEVVLSFLVPHILSGQTDEFKAIIRSKLIGIAERAGEVNDNGSDRAGHWAVEYMANLLSGIADPEPQHDS